MVVPRHDTRYALQIKTKLRDDKTMKCALGVVLDVVSDLCRDSQAFCQWHGAELTADNRRMLVVPEGCGMDFRDLRG